MNTPTSNLLREYIRKRNFSATSEPRAVLKSKKSGDFVVHLHAARRLHYDLRLQWLGVLKCWAIPKGPSYSPEDKRLAVQTEDHPDDYKSFEGVIPKGSYGAGPTLIWDAGEYIPLDDFEKGMKKGHIRFLADGIRLKGIWNLIKFKNEEKNWLFIKEADEFANFCDLEVFATSVTTGRTLDDLKG